jgi:hypothetical protein
VRFFSTTGAFTHETTGAFKGFLLRAATSANAFVYHSHLDNKNKLPFPMRAVERVLFLTRKIKAPKLLHGVLFVVGVLSFVRTMVLFAETYSVVAAERNDNNDLLSLCKKGAASSSSHFRNACLQARAEQAAPIIFKVLMRSVRQQFIDFANAFNTPSRILLLALFLLSGLAVPIVKTMANLINAYLTPNLAGLHGLGHLHEDEEQTPVSSVVVLGGGRESVYNKLRMLPSRRRFRQQTISLTPPEEEEYDDSAEWRTVGIGRADDP